MKAEKTINILYFVITAAVIIPLFYLLLAKVQPNVFNFRFNPYGILPFIGVFAQIIILILINRGKETSKVVFWFSMVLIAIMLWGIGEGFQRFGADPQTAMFWLSICAIGWIFLPIAFFFVVLYYTNNETLIKHSWQFLILFAPAIIIFYLVYFTELLITTSPEKAHLFSYGYDNKGTPYFIVYFIWTEALMVASVILLILHYKQRKTAVERRKTLLFIIGITIPLLGATISDLIFVILDIDILTIGVLFTSFTGIIVGYAILRYKLFNFNPASVSSYILETMSEGLLILDKSFKIEYANKRAMELLKQNHDQITGSSMRNYFTTIQEWEKFQNELIIPLETKQIIEASENEIVTPDSKIVPISFSSTRVVTDKKNQEITYIISLTDISEIQKSNYFLEEKVKERTLELEKTKANLEITVKERTKQLEEKLNELAQLNSDLKTLNNFMVGRELKMMELKKELEKLKNNPPHPDTSENPDSPTTNF